MGNSTQHFLKMSGTVPPGKHKEFEQTFRFVLHHLNPDCIQFILSTDLFTPNLYHFYSLWQTEDSLEGFCKSQEFEVLAGAFKTLGEPEKNLAGELVDIESFRVKDMGV